MPDIKESLDELYAKLRKERKAEVKRRLHMLVLIKEGKSRTRKEASKRIAVHRNTIRDWLTRYESGGVDAIVQIKSSGAPSGQRSLPERVLGFLKERLAETTAMA